MFLTFGSTSFNILFTFSSVEDTSPFGILSLTFLISFILTDGLETGFSWLIFFPVSFSIDGGWGEGVFFLLINIGGCFNDCTRFSVLTDVGVISFSWSVCLHILDDEGETGSLVLLMSWVVVGFDDTGGGDGGSASATFHLII